MDFLSVKNLGSSRVVTDKFKPILQPRSSCSVAMKSTVLLTWVFVMIALVADLIGPAEGHLMKYDSSHDMVDVSNSNFFVASL